MKFYVIVDAQNDFITGTLGNPKAKKAVSKIVKELKENFGEAEMLFTLDTHGSDYPLTLEGQKLPIEHCFKGTEGWALERRLKKFAKKGTCVEKSGFGYTNWSNTLAKCDFDPLEDEIHIFGFCTDICVISNALILRALYPNTKIICHASLCAGTSTKAHKAALGVMESCHIDIVE